MVKHTAHRYLCVFLPIIMLISLLTGIPFLLNGCQAASVSPVSKTAFCLDTVITVTVYEEADESILDGCLALCSDYELLFSRTNPESELYRLNHGLLPRQGDGQIVSEETANLIALGLSYCALSDGAFDISIAPVSSLWNFSAEAPLKPESAAIAEALTHVDYKDVSVSGNVVTFAKEGMALDLGAIAKGYIADQMAYYLKQHGISNAVLNLGGNVLCMGQKPDHTPYRVGIQKPFAAQGESLLAVTLTDMSVVSSGTYERYFRQNGTLYHHILNPADGYPCNNGLSGVTILSRHSADADALSTVCFLLGTEKGMALIETLPDTEALFIKEDGTLYRSSGFPQK